MASQVAKLVWLNFDLLFFYICRLALPLRSSSFLQVASLRQQLEHLQRGGGQGGGRGEGGVGAGGCGHEAPCGRSLSAMERAHRQALEELKKQRDRQMEELQAEKDRLLLEETQATARGRQSNKSLLTTYSVCSQNSQTHFI